MEHSDINTEHSTASVIMAKNIGEKALSSSLAKSGTSKVRLSDPRSSSITVESDPPPILLRTCQKMELNELLDLLLQQH